MRKILSFTVIVILLLSVTGIALAAARNENKLSLEVLYNVPYNSDYANSGLSIGLAYPFLSIFRISADAQFPFFTNNGRNDPPGLTAGAGFSIPLSGIHLIVDFKKGFDLGSGGINNYGDICDVGIDLPLSERSAFRSYYREIKNIGSRYNVPDDKIRYIGFGFDYKL